MKKDIQLLAIENGFSEYGQTFFNNECCDMYIFDDIFFHDMFILDIENLHLTEINANRHTWYVGDTRAFKDNDGNIFFVVNNDLTTFDDSYFNTDDIEIDDYMDWLNE